MPAKNHDAPLAVDVCPRATQCAHNATTRIGRNGTCPDCGTIVYKDRARPGGVPSGPGAFLHGEITYNGG